MLSPNTSARTSWNFDDFRSVDTLVSNNWLFQTRKTRNTLETEACFLEHRSHKQGMCLSWSHSNTTSWCMSTTAWVTPYLPTLLVKAIFLLHPACAETLCKVCKIMSCRQITGVLTLSRHHNQFVWVALLNEQLQASPAWELSQ